jgi:uncharacterized membrane protein
LPPTGEYPTQRPQPTGDYPGPRPQPTGEYLAVRHEHSHDQPGVLTVGREIRSHAASSREGRGHRRSAPGDGHRHGHDANLAVSRRTVTIVRWILIPSAVLTAILLGVLWPGRAETPQPGGASLQRAYGQVLRVTEVPCPTGAQTFGRPLPCGGAVVRISSGPGAGQDVSVDLPQGPGAPRVSAGDDVVLTYLADPSGEGPPRIAVMDQQRGGELLVMLGLCAIAVIAFGRWRGLTALIGLGVSFAFLLLFIVPAILNGQAPLPVAIVGSAAIMFAVLYLTHGFSVTTSVAVLGTLVSLVVTGLLGALFTATTALTGFGSDESMYLSVLNSEVDMRGLLLAGIIIGALGVLDDVTITQATTVAELAPNAPSRLALFRSAIRVGRAHVGSAVNTIILAYAGASLPLLLLVVAGGQDISDLLTGQFLAQEIVRAAVGTMGLVAAVPITTGLAALVADLRSPSGARRARDPDRREPDARRESEPRRDRPRREPEPTAGW